MDPRVVEIARRLHSNSCYWWCQLGSPRCDGSPTGIEFRRAADWLDAVEDVSATAAASAAAIRHHLAAQPA